MYYMKHDKVPPSTSWVPSRVPCGEAVSVQDRDWQTPGWKELGVSAMEKLWFQVRVVATEEAVTLEARGDLRCTDHLTRVVQVLTRDSRGLQRGPVREMSP